MLQAGGFASSQPRSDVCRQKKRFEMKAVKYLQIIVTAFNCLSSSSASFFLSFGATAPSGPGPPHSRGY